MKILNSLLFIIVILSIINNINAEQCKSCFSQGQKCMVQVENAPPGYYTPGGECNEGLVCGPQKEGDEEGDYVCIKRFNLNEKCTGYDTCSLGLFCEKGVCLNSRFASIGEECKQVSDCSSEYANCTGGVCINPTNDCQDINDCKFGSTCVNEKCVNSLTQGQSCDESSSDTPNCLIGLMCIPFDGTTTKGTCGPLFSKKLGEHCQGLDSECNANEGLYCSPKADVCEEYIEPKQPTTNCSLTENACGDSYHSCSCDGKCYQSDPLPTQYATVYEPLINCLVENKCSFITNAFSSKSCITKNCGKLFCSYSSVMFSADNPLTCGNTHQSEDYCGQFNGSHKLSSPSSLLFIIFTIITFLLY